MRKPVWKEALSSCADADRARRFLEDFTALHGPDLEKKTSAEHVRILASLFSGSISMSELLLSHPEWVGTVLNPESLIGPRQKKGLEREIQSWLVPLIREQNYSDAYRKLREFKQREMMRVGARDLARLGTLTENIKEISNVADVCLQAVYTLCSSQLTERFGHPFHQDADNRWVPTDFCVLGLGKLGGRELNYSSDVDVMFLYSEEGHVFRDGPPDAKGTGKGLINHKFFTRLAESIIAEVSRLTSDGTLFRIDLRLRPEGDSGPLVRSLNSYENYYAQWGQTWERMMLIKARCVAGDIGLAAELLETIHAFRYPRAMSERIVQEIGAMKCRIEIEVVKPGEIDRNVKLGRGGIREVEFIVQTLQLLNAGRIPFLQDSQTLSALQKLVRYKILSEADAEVLSSAYCFLRAVEHRLQMENDMQTHTIPKERKALVRLASLMGHASLAQFERAKKKHVSAVRAIYDNLLKCGDSTDRPRLPSLESGEAQWRELLPEHGFLDVERGLHLIRLFVEGPGFVHVSTRTAELALRLISELLEFCPKRSRVSTEGKLASDVLSDPDRVLARLDSFIAAYGSRSMLYETWTSTPSLFRLLVFLFDRSEFLAETAIRTPDLVDELELSGRLRRRKTAIEILQDLRHGKADRDQHLWIRKYHQAELMRIGLRDILGLADYEQNLCELSALADACLQYALEVVIRKHKRKRPPFAIIGLGKLGGSELNYGSDLDVVFVAEDREKNLPLVQRMAAEIIDLLSIATEMGSVYDVDTRLRPDGDKGLLVNTISAYEDYYRTRAQLWEIQALSRSRPVAGSPTVWKQFEALAAGVTDFTTPPKHLLAYVSNWKQKIHEMRMRIEQERTPSGKQQLAIKTGAGGLIDVEFIAQARGMEYGWHEPNTLRSLEIGRQSETLAPALSDELIENYRKLRRVEGVLRRWNYASESVLPEESAPRERVALRCGYSSGKAFMKEVDQCRKVIRSIYNRVFHG